jgi:hypothetical protein
LSEQVLPTVVELVLLEVLAMQPAELPMESFLLGMDKYMCLVWKLAFGFIV